MGEPARQRYDDGDEQPVVRPNLRAIEGGGETSVPKRDHLKAVDSDDKKAASGEALNSAEQQGVAAGGGKVDGKEAGFFKPEADEKGGGTNSKDEKKNKFWTKRKKILGGSIAGVVVGGGFGVFTLFSGPLQFIHAAQLLERFHFSDQESFFEDRTSKIYRYFKWNDKPQNRRLSRVGNKLADSIEKKFLKAGIKPEFNSASGRLMFVDIDVDTARSAGVDVDALRAEFDVEDLGFDRIRIDIENKVTTTFKEKKLFRNLRRASGNTGLVAATQGRLFGARARLTYHPIRRLDDSIIDTVKEKWAARKTTVIEAGERISVQGDARPAEDPDAPPQESDAQRAAGELEEIADVEPRPDGQPDIDGVKGNLRLRVLGGASAITGITCLVNQISASATEYEYQNVVLPSMRMAGYMISLGHQVMAGDDIDTTQLGFEDEQMYGRSGGDPSEPETSFFDAESIRAEEGRSGTGIDTPDSAKIGGSTNILSGIRASLGGIAGITDSFCGAANSFLGQVVTFGIDLVTAPVSAGVAVAVGQALSPYLDDLARIIAGSEISTDLAGAALGGVTNQGAFFMANQQFISMGGTAVSDAERSELVSQRRALEREFQNEKPWTERYFALMSPDSLVGKFIDSYRGAPNVASLLTTPSSLWSGLASTFTPRASAETNYDYGVPKFAFRPSEVTLMNNDESYANPYENLARIENRIPQMHSDFSEKCFGLKFDDQENFQMTQIINMQTYPDDCKRTDEEFTRYRLYVADLMVHVSADCYEGDPVSCQQIGFGGGTAQQSIAANPNIYVIGDSLTVGMDQLGGLSQKLGAKGWTVTGVLAENSATTDSLIGKLDTAAISRSGTVVVALGTNPAPDSNKADYEEKIQTFIENIKRSAPAARIIWVNAYSLASSYPGTNAAISSQSGALKYSIIGWLQEATKNAGLYPFAADGIHHTNAGYAAKANFLAEGVGVPSTAAGSAIVGDPYSDSTGVACAPGTTDMGIHDGYVQGILIKLRLCSLPNLPSVGQADNPGGDFSTPGASGFAIVNSRVSGAWYQLANDATAAGISLVSRSSFRSMVHQEDLWRENPDSSEVARPGFSSHQAGVAIDFLNMPGSGGETCQNRARSLSSPGWLWLRDNAEKYGFKQYSAEAWHWDALPVANRCDSSQP